MRVKKDLDIIYGEIFKFFYSIKHTEYTLTRENLFRIFKWRKGKK